MRCLINFSDSNYSLAQKYCSKKARQCGGFDKIIEYTPEDIPDSIIKLCPQSFYGDNRKAKRYGLWRPYIIKHTLAQLEYGDFLCYCDAGGYFIRNVSPIFEEMEKNLKDIRVSQLPLVEKQWTKRDVFICLDADYEEIYDSNQICSGFIFIRKTENSVSFFDKFYDIAIRYPYLFTDEANRLGKENYPSFIENRHNQSVFSVLCKKWGIIPDEDISEYGLHPKLYSYTPNVIYREEKRLLCIPYYISHRRNKVTWMVHIGNFLRIILPASCFIILLKGALKVNGGIKKWKRKLNLQKTQ